MDVAQRIRKRIGELRIAPPDGTATVTISIGVATMRQEDTAESIVLRADAALYAAKEAGRNRCLAAPETAPPLECGA